MVINGIEFDVVSRQVESHPFREFSATYGGHLHPSDTPRHSARPGRGLAIESVVEVDTVYLLSTCERYAMRCRYAELQAYVSKEAA